jgi:UDP-N-acetylglucosamine--N-acetylmuramyl-(pentapeptide) pyrophosphoryl-undecaprenol N-acetylglucosamine transferase
LPVGLAASILRIKIITHDSDVMPGLTNRILSRYAAILAVGMPVKNYPQYTGKNIVYTGIPVRDQFVYPINKQEALNKLNISNSNPVVVIVGGSLGAIRVNNSVIKVANELVNNSGSNIIWYTGDTQYDEINSMVQKMSSDISSKITVEPFSNQLEVAFVAADVVVSRAGATTIAELSILKKPTIIIPNPLLTGGHQLKNADMLLDNNAVLVLTEEQLLNNPSVLVESINKLLSDNTLRENLSDNIGKLAKPDAALHIAKLILGLDDAKAKNELV